MEKKRFLSRLLVFLLLQVVFVVVYVSSYVVEDTHSRYIEQQKDQVYANYTALYFDSNVKTATLALENDVAYINFDLMNFIGEDVTKRDIIYDIVTPDKYYNNKAEVVTPDGSDNLHVLDEWDQPVKIGKDTYKYKTEVIENTGEDGGNSDYKFTYETISSGGSEGEVSGEKGVGKTHNVTVKLTRTESSALTVGESVSLVIQLSEPYAEILIIDLVILDKLITFSNNKGTMFDTEFEKLSIQSVNIYSHVQSGTNYIERNVPDEENLFFSSYGFKVTVYYDNLILDDNSLDQLHIPNNGQVGSNIDITKPYLIDMKFNSSSNGEIVLYVPQASSFDINFLKTSSDYKFEVKVEAYIYNKTSDTYSYVLYDTALGGYEHNASSKYEVAKRGA